MVYEVPATADLLMLAQRSAELSRMAVASAAFHEGIRGIKRPEVITRAGNLSLEGVEAIPTQQWDPEADDGDTIVRGID